MVEKTLNLKVPVVLEEGATLPLYATEGSAGLDLALVEDVILHPGQRVLARTGVSVALPPGYEGQVRPRSGLALDYGVTMVNSPGTIDSDYRGEIKLLLINLGHETVALSKGDCVAQLVVAPVARVHLEVVASLPPSERGEGGFGSSGRF